jgi:hypothetical protein
MATCIVVMPPSLSGSGWGQGYVPMSDRPLTVYYKRLDEDGETTWHFKMEFDKMKDATATIELDGFTWHSYAYDNGCGMERYNK